MPPLLFKPIGAVILSEGRSPQRRTHLMYLVSGSLSRKKGGRLRPTEGPITLINNGPPPQSPPHSGADR